MKISSSRFSSPRGMALLLTLAFLVLLTALILAFFSTVQTEVTSASAYDRNVSAKQLVDSAAQIVMGQIVDGTKSFKPGGTAATDRLAWASQPGLIRAWDAAGAGWKAFKLYSSADMVIDLSVGPYKPSDSAVLSAEIPATWPALPARYTDLNAPVMVQDAAGSITRGGKTYRASYPIVDAAALIGADAVEGFGLTATAPGSSTAPASLTAGTDPSQLSGGLTSNPVPMPVAWIYVLRDGTLTVPTGGSGTTATWGGSNAPTAANPIVGRVSFWTDDDSCKINVNTASEPTPWDTPRMVGKEDLKYGNNQPAALEFQRFPGHSFMTALSPVFFPNTASKDLTAAQKEQIYQLIPRVGLGGSLAGTKSVLAVPIPKITTDQDRLFANVDEFLFQPNRSLASSVSAAITPAKLKQSRFFLTANSRAPEINLFGQPRVSLWPVWSTASDRTTYDKLSAFCSTLGTPPLAYYFQRSDDGSSTADWSGIPRNRELYGYLQNLTNTAIPGFGASLSTKWDSDRDQILTEIFDYIRCVNLKDPQSDPGLGAAKQGKYFSENQSVRENRTLHGQVTPIIINNTKGFGRFNTISQFGMHFICVQSGTTGISNPVVVRKEAGDVQANLPAGQRAIEAAFVFEPFSPSLGWYALKEFYSVDVQFSPMTINGQPLNMRPGSSYMDNVVGWGQFRQGLERGGSAGIRSAIDGFTFRSGSPVLGKYPWTSQITTAALSRPVVTGADQLMDFSGGTVTVRIYSGLAATNLVQTFTINIPGGNIPIPDIVPGDWRWWSFYNRYEYNRIRSSAPLTPGIEYPNGARRWVNTSGFNDASVFRQEDVVRAVVPNHGDIRLVAAKENVPITDFVPVRSDVWEDVPNARFLHIFSEISGTQYLFGNSNEPGLSGVGGITPVNADDQLHGSAQVEYHYSRLPEIRPGAGKIFNQWGDFDNGLAQWTDGAYINKPDEGNVRAWNGGVPYFTTDEWVENDVQQTGQSNLVITFSPSRIIPSAGMLGSLPTGVMRNQPWQTLLFRPEVINHPGRGIPQSGPPYTSPPDSLVMDLFWNPAVEPYAISEPFSTAGKVNMNYEIVPFTYIRRATALHAVMKAEEPLLIPNTASKVYKLYRSEVGTNLFANAGNDPSVTAEWNKIFNGTAPFDRLRRPINMSQTLGQFDTRFSGGEIFRSATQICDIHLVRDGETLSEYTGNSIWPNNLVTGDNTRERPYTNLYARLTTKSNVFTVHVRAQVLRQPVSSPAGQWDEAKGQVAAEFRGSTILERYIDSADPTIVDFALPVNKDAVVDSNYKFRVLANKKFTP